MVSPELIRRYPFFAGLSYEHIVTLAKAADELSVRSGHYFFHEGDELSYFYLTLDGEVVIAIDLPKQDESYRLAEVVTREFETEAVTVINIGPGEVFGWSALVPPHTATSSCKALTSSRVMAFDCLKLRRSFEEDSEFGYLMVQKAAQVIRSRLRAMRTESLANLVT
ncbi:MAG: Crp/Fnr family transcriptional regulator [Anaerolineae bacterium]|nr:Crp/Fnr family transcriptional regulator [Anaerolineae bacterium]